MSALALLELQRALYAKLNGDSGLMASVVAVYDNVPQHTEVPYIVIGEGSQTIQPADALVLSECQLELHVYTSIGGRKTALQTLQKLYVLLHLGTLTLTGFQLILMRVEQTGTALVEEGALLKGTMTLFVAVAEV